MWIFQHNLSDFSMVHGGVDHHWSVRAESLRVCSVFALCCVFRQRLSLSPASHSLLLFCLHKQNGERAEPGDAANTLHLSERSRQHNTSPDIILNFCILLTFPCRSSRTWSFINTESHMQTKWFLSANALNINVNIIKIRYCAFLSCFIIPIRRAALSLLLKQH